MLVTFWAQSSCYSSTERTKPLRSNPGFLVKILLDFTCQKVLCHILPIVVRHRSYCLPIELCLASLRPLLPHSKDHLSKGATMIERRLHAICFFQTDLWLADDHDADGHDADQWDIYHMQSLVSLVSFRLPIAFWRSLANRETVKKAKFWPRKDKCIHSTCWHRDLWKVCFPCKEN